MEHTTDQLELDECPHCSGWVARIGDTELEDDCPLTACWRALKQHNGSNPMSNVDRMNDQHMEKLEQFLDGHLNPPELFGLQAMQQHAWNQMRLARELKQDLFGREGESSTPNSEGATS